MIAVALDRHLEPVMYDIPFTNLVWASRFFDYGEFQMQLPVGYYTNEWCYVILDGHDDRVAMVQRMEYDGEGQQVISGFFAEKVLDHGIITLTNGYSPGTLYGACSDMIDRYYNGTCSSRLRAGFVNDGFAPANESVPSIQMERNYIGQEITKLLSLHGLSYRASLSEDGLGVDMRIYGQDAKQDSELVELSSVYGELTDIKYVSDDSARRNTAVVTYGKNDVTGVNFAYVRVTDPLKPSVETRGLDMQLLVDAGDGATEQEAIDKGRKELEKYVHETNLDAKILDTSIYGNTVNLGDEVMLSVPEIGISARTRIVEATEVFKGNAREVTLGLGTKRYTMIERAVK